MFTHEHTQQEINAELNSSVIQATLRPCDLIPAFLEVIRDTPEYAQIMMDTANNWELKVFTDPTAGEQDERWESEEISYFLNETLMDTLNSYAPEGYYFGSHEGDGSDFGYWKVDGEEDSDQNTDGNNEDDDTEFFWATFNYIGELKIPSIVVDECTVTGKDAYPYVTAQMEDETIKAQFDELKPEDVVKELSEYGAWDDEELKDHKENLVRLLWIASWNIFDEN